jgi:hypothetical protein
VNFKFRHRIVIAALVLFLVIAVIAAIRNR